MDTHKLNATLLSNWPLKTQRARARVWAVVFTINHIPVSMTAFNVPKKFLWFVIYFSFYSKNFEVFPCLFSMTHRLFSHLHVIVQFLLLLTSNPIPPQSYKKQAFILILLYLLRIKLLPVVWSILVNVPCAIERRNVYSDALGEVFCECLLDPCCLLILIFLS